MQAPEQHHFFRSWVLSKAFIAICILFALYGITALSIATQPSLGVIALSLTLSGAITLSLGVLGLLVSLIHFVWSTPDKVYSNM